MHVILSNKKLWVWILNVKTKQETTFCKINSRETLLQGRDLYSFRGLSLWWREKQQWRREETIRVIVTFEILEKDRDRPKHAMLFVQHCYIMMMHSIIRKEERKQTQKRKKWEKTLAFFFLFFFSSISKRKACVSFGSEWGIWPAACPSWCLLWI